MTHASHTIAPRSKPARTATALGRIGNVIVDPVTAFAHVDTTPTSALAFLALVALRFASVLAFYRPNVDPAHLAAGVLFQVVTLWPLTVLLALLLWTTARAWGARTSWSSAYCVVVHVMLAYTLATIAIASAAAALLPESTNVELRHPPFTNLSSLVSGTATPIAPALLAELDYRSAYALVLTFIGVRAATTDATGSRAWLIVATCFAANLLLTTITAFVRHS